MLHWVNVELWGPLWPNLVASLITFVPGFLWAHRKLLTKWEEQEAAHLKRHHELKRMLSQAPFPSDPVDVKPQPLKENDDHLRP